MRALVTGATGFIGRRLVASLERPVVLSRRPQAAMRILGDVEAHAWEPEAGPPPSEALEGVDIVFNLAGESVAGGRWTTARKARILSSRVIGTRNLLTGMEAQKVRPRVLVSASAVGYYGSCGDEILEEGAQPGNDFLAKVCKAWESEAYRASALGVRVVTPRIGLVLGKNGGALARMLLPFKLCLGGRLGNGNHWVPWIHLDDLIGILLHAANHEISGPMNAVGPAPVTNREFTRVLASALHRPALFPVPEFGLRLLFGELASVLLASQRVVPRVVEETNYLYRYASLDEALREIVNT
jgi:uncharacterized protein